MVETLATLGSERVWLVHGQGLDELTVAGESQVVELRDGAIRAFTVTPEEAGLPRAPIAAIRGGDAAANASALAALLQGAPGPYRDTVVLNAAAALIVAGRTTTLADGAKLATAAIADGSARGALETLRRETA
jgi:anthranilate phosphoribosyltransferase